MTREVKGRLRGARRRLSNLVIFRTDPGAGNPYPQCSPTALPLRLGWAERSMMEMLLSGLVFVAFLLAQIAAVVAVQAQRNSAHSQAYDAIQRDRGARVIWDSAN